MTNKISGVARISATRGCPLKCHPFHPSNLLTKVYNERRSCFVLCKVIRNIKASFPSDSNAHNWMGFVFILDMVLLFLPVRQFSHHFLFLFFCFLYICIYGPCILKLSPLLVFSLRQVAPLSFNHLHILGDQTKNLLLRGPIGAVIAGYLFYRCKHLYVYISCSISVFN